MILCFSGIYLEFERIMDDFRFYNFLLCLEDICTSDFLAEKQVTIDIPYFVSEKTQLRKIIKTFSGYKQINTYFYKKLGP